jgi:hypothetical protein
MDIDTMNKAKIVIAAHDKRMKAHENNPRTRSRRSSAQQDKAPTDNAASLSRATSTPAPAPAPVVPPPSLPPPSLPPPSTKNRFRLLVDTEALSSDDDDDLDTEWNQVSVRNKPNSSAIPYLTSSTRPSPNRIAQKWLRKIGNRQERQTTV